MEDLRKLLVISKEANENEVKEIFKLLSEKLLKDYSIVKGKERYRFLEIEFYFYNKYHKDVSVYRRTIQAGKWYIHLSGVDISFESCYVSKEFSENYYGGILIRSIQNMQYDSIVNGPLCCLIELFQNIDINGNSENTPRIEKYKQENIDIKTLCRYGIKSNLKYCYYNASPDLKWKSNYKANPLKRI